MIPVRCRTNLDAYKHKAWPYLMRVIPNRGDMVKARDGSVLYVCGITHSHPEGSDPVVEIELHQSPSRF